MAFTVLVIGDQIAPEGLSLIEAAGGMCIPSGAYPARAEFIRLMETHQPDALIVRTVDFIDAQMIRASPALRLIAKHGVGVNEIDVAAADQMGIPVVITTGANAQSVAEHAFGMILALAKDFARQDQLIRGGTFDKKLYAGREIRGQVLGIVGHGAIGGKVARMGLAFGMRVLAHDPHPADAPYPEGVEPSALDDLLSRADFVSLHCPATDLTRNLLDAQRLSLMKPTACLINTARGDVVDEAALVAALAGGRLAGAGLDAFAHEPEVPARLLQMPNVIHSPHVAGVTRDAMRAVSIMAAANVVTLFAGAPLEARRFVTTSRRLAAAVV